MDASFNLLPVVATWKKEMKHRQQRKTNEENASLPSLLY